MATAMVVVLLGGGTGAGARAGDLPGAAGAWQVLFDGGSTEAWRGFRRDDFPDDGWEVADGALVPRPDGTVVDLVTRRVFRDFELEVEWRVSERGNGGILVRVGEHRPETWQTGPEVQILDDTNHPDAGDPRTSAGSIYGLAAPGPKALLPVGEFNRSRIVVIGDRLMQDLNGRRIMDVDLAAPAFRAAVEAGKFAEFPDFARLREGHIALQHASVSRFRAPIAYRSVRVRERTVAGAGAGVGAEDPGRVGVARVDITPDYPVRLTGYAARSEMATETLQTLWAKALALGGGEGGGRVLITVDNCGVPGGVADEVAARLQRKAGLRREDVVVASSHTHYAPMVRGFAENIFVRDLTPEEAAASDRYTAELTDALERVALQALADRRPGRLYHGQGEVGFAGNRRPAGGPVDPALPVLVARGGDGGIRALVANYACHCTTMGHQINAHHGDWAGHAQAFLEAEHPGATALITIGCGADANPNPRGGDDFGLALSQRHGRALADGVKEVLAGPLTALPPLPEAAFRRLTLPFQALPDRAEWERRAGEAGIVGYHARRQLARLDRGEALPVELPYSVQGWRFGSALTMVFLPGEVVVDYALRLKREAGTDRLWVTAYANDVPCYIPSRRILAEGGYEAESSLWYYDRPARLAPEVEDRIHRAVAETVPGWGRLGR